MTDVDELLKQKDQAYWERNQCVAALTKVFPGCAWLALHDESDVVWDHDWRWIVFIDIPVKHGSQITIEQVSWHIHDTEREDFAHLPVRLNTWDGHDTETKYKRLASIVRG